MPRKLRNPKLRTALTLADIGLHDILFFIGPWSPPLTAPEKARSRWQSWPEYFAEYDAVKEELAASTLLQPGQAPFAERVRQEMRDRPGEVWQAHFHRALRHSHFCKPGGAHIHENLATLGAAVEAEGTQARQDGPPGQS
jgi:hypothetical protein